MNLLPFATFDQMRPANRRLVQIMFCVALILGGIEDFYGRVRYSADAINYLDIVRAIHAGEWKIAINSYWGLGYPLLLAAITPLFPHSSSGEWLAVHCLNLLIFLATFLTFFSLVWAIARSPRMSWIVADVKVERFLIVGTYTIFLSIELSMDNVSRVGPDLLVSCLMFAAASLLFKMADQPNAVRAIALGLTLGLGYLVKTIFLPLTLVFAVVATAILWRKRQRVPYPLLILCAALVIALPNVVAMSWATGGLTFGDSGSLNFAWNVNKLEPGGLWQGLPPGHGTPIHPARMLSADPHIYIFDGPFPVTFGPFFNPPYYYQGYRTYFNLKALIHETGGNVFRLLRALAVQLVIYGLLACWLTNRGRSRRGTTTPRDLWALWPLLSFSIAAIAIYLLVFVEARYVASFIAILMLSLLFVVVAQIAIEGRSSSALRISASLQWMLLLGCFGTLALTQRDADRNVVGHALHHQYFSNDEQWKAGLYLAQTGSKPGDKVAVMTDLVSATRSNWAYMDRLQIIGILGGSLLEAQKADFDTYWHASPEARARMLSPFAEAGARMILATEKPSGVVAEEWEAVPGTALWIHRF